MNDLPLRIAACTFLLSLLPGGSLAQAPQPKPEESCGDIERNYELIKADAVAMQTNIALFAAAEGEKHSTVALLLDKGADPNLTGRSELTPLIAAAFKGNDRIVEMLLAHGADPNVRDTTGKTAMIYAAARGFDDVVRRLLDAGVDVNARAGNDLTPLMWTAGH